MAAHRSCIQGLGMQPATAWQLSTADARKTQLLTQRQGRNALPLCCVAKIGCVPPPSPIPHMHVRLSDANSQPHTNHNAKPGTNTGTKANTNTKANTGTKANIDTKAIWNTRPGISAGIKANTNTKANANKRSHTA
eukprot:363029-Chlamydomonas_euryale.AAC.6